VAIPRKESKHRNTCGPNVRRFRLARKLSQEKLAAKCQLLGWDVSRVTIATLEGQNRIVADFELKFLSVALRAKLDDLLPS